MTKLGVGSYVTATRSETGKRVLAQVVKDYNLSLSAKVTVRFESDNNDSEVFFHDILLLNGEKPETVVDLTNLPVEETPPAPPAAQEPVVQRNERAVTADPHISYLHGVSSPGRPETPRSHDQTPILSPSTPPRATTQNAGRRSWLLQRTEPRVSTSPTGPQGQSSRVQPGSHTSPIRRPDGRLSAPIPRIPIPGSSAHVNHSSPIRRPDGRLSDPIPRIRTTGSSHASASSTVRADGRASAPIPRIRPKTTTPPRRSTFSLADYIPRHPIATSLNDDVPIPRIRSTSTKPTVNRQRMDFEQIASDQVPPATKQKKKEKEPFCSRRLQKRRQQSRVFGGDLTLLPLVPPRHDIPDVIIEPPNFMGNGYSAYLFSEPTTTAKDAEFFDELWDKVRANDEYISPIPDQPPGAPLGRGGRRKNEKPKRTRSMYLKCRGEGPPDELDDPKWDSEPKDIPDHLVAGNQYNEDLRKPRLFTCTSSCEHADEDSFYQPPAIQCRKCGLWTHLACARLDLAVLSPDASNFYVCMTCMDNIPMFLPIPALVPQSIG